MVAKTKAKGGFLELVKTMVYALLLAGVIRTLFFQPFWIPSGSMMPTLLIGDFLFVNKMAYGYSRYSCPFSLCPIDGRILARDPHRGDVVVFKHPTNGTDYIKRLIGLPGDRIQMIDGVLQINGAALPQEPDGQFVEVNLPQGPMRSMPRCANRPVEPGGECITERSIETLPEGKRHAILNIEDGFGDNTPVFTVPEGEFFFMGDNRDNSMDSRFPRSAGRGRVRAVREPRRPRRPGDLLLGRAVDARLLDLAARQVLQGGAVKLGRGMAGAEARLGHGFARPELLIEALTHPSFAGVADNQRLEFLGDRVLGLVIAGALLDGGSRAPARATSPRGSTRWSARRPAPRWPPRSTSAAPCAWGARRCSRAGASARRSSGTPWRR